MHHTYICAPSLLKLYQNPLCQMVPCVIGEIWTRDPNGNADLSQLVGTLPEPIDSDGAVCYRGKRARDTAMERTWKKMMKHLFTLMEAAPAVERA